MNPFCLHQGFPPLHRYPSLPLNLQNLNDMSLLFGYNTLKFSELYCVIRNFNLWHLSFLKEMEVKLKKAESQVKFYEESFAKQRDVMQKRILSLVREHELARKDALLLKWGVTFIKPIKFRQLLLSIMFVFRADNARMQSNQIYLNENAKSSKMDYELKCVEVSKLKENLSQQKVLIKFSHRSF